MSRMGVYLVEYGRVWVLMRARIRLSVADVELDKSFTCSSRIFCL
jgi:hypothetical protein